MVVGLGLGYGAGYREGLSDERHAWMTTEVTLPDIPMPKTEALDRLIQRIHRGSLTVYSDPHVGGMKFIGGGRWMRNTLDPRALPEQIRSFPQ